MTKLFICNRINCKMECYQNMSKIFWCLQNRELRIFPITEIDLICEDTFTTNKNKYSKSQVESIMS